MEHAAANQDFQFLTAEIESLMREPPTSTDTTYPRSKRVATFIAVGATAALFGLGMGIGSSLKCGISGIFSSCPDLPEENKRKLQESIRKINNISATLLEVETDTNNKMFLVTSTSAPDSGLTETVCQSTKSELGDDEQSCSPSPTVYN